MKRFEKFYVYGYENKNYTRQTFISYCTEEKLANSSKVKRVLIRLFHCTLYEKPFKELSAAIYSLVHFSMRVRLPHMLSLSRSENPF